MVKNKIILIDDIHFESRNDSDRIKFLNEIQAKVSDIKQSGYHPVVVLAGDIDTGLSGIKWASDIETDVVYVSGNHEYWGDDVFDLDFKIKKEIRENPLKYKNLHYLQKDTVIINGMRFIGATLWTDVANKYPWDQGVNQALRYFWVMGDFKRITAKKWYKEDNIITLRKELTKSGVGKDKINFLIENKLFNPIIERQINKEQLRFIEDTLNDDYMGVNVVVTHHLPLYKSWLISKNIEVDDILHRDINDPDKILRSFTSNDKKVKEVIMMSYYANECSYLLKNTKTPPLFWFHGHLHIKSNTVHYLTNVMSSPVGYGGQSNKLKYEVIEQSSKIKDEIKTMISDYNWGAGMYDNIVLFYNALVYWGNSKKNEESIEDLRGHYLYFIDNHVKNIKSLDKHIRYWLAFLFFGTTGERISEERTSIEHYLQVKNFATTGLGCFYIPLYKINQDNLRKNYEVWLEEVKMMINYTEKFKDRLIMYVDNFN